MKLFNSTIALVLVASVAAAVPARTLLQDGADKQEAKVEERASEPYTLDVCPVSGEKLGSMGDPIVMTVEGREVRLCCKGCVGKIEKDPAKYLASVDRGLAAQQKPYYPMTTCIVTGEPLTEDGKDIAVDIIIKNRLFRVCCKGCVGKVKAKEAEYFTKLDAEVVKAQREHYPLANCIVRDKSELGSMGDPVEIVVGNRLVRFCCAGCVKGFHAKSTEFIAKLDKAWAPLHARAGKGHAKKKAGDHGEHGDHGDGHK